MKVFLYTQQTIHILGTGPSLQDFLNWPKNYHKTTITIGVNNIYRYYPTEFLLVADREEQHKDAGKYNTIVNSSPMGFYTWLPSHWCMMENRILYKPKTVHDEDAQLDGNYLLWNLTGAFSAIHLAYKMQAKEIVLWGVDLTSPEFQKKLFWLISGFAKLQKLMEAKGVKIYHGQPKKSELGALFKKWDY
jgi:hypothetical protein